MSSLDRLIKLAQKTGDKLIVHDPLYGEDVVIMSVDQYEDMIDKSQSETDTWDLEDYNRKWKEYRDDPFAPASSAPTPPGWYDELEEDEDEEEYDLPWEEESPWQSTGSIIDDLYPQEGIPGPELTSHGSDYDLASDYEEDWEIDDPALPSTPDFYSTNVHEEPQLSQVPYQNHGEFEMNKASIDDEPVFYEEPI